MMNDQFIPYKQTIQPADLETAIDDISEVVKKTNDNELLIKLGEILGKMSIYRLTGDNAVIESVVIDLAIIINRISNICTTNSASDDLYDGNVVLTGKPIDLIYFSRLDDGWMDKKTLLNGFYEFLVAEKDAYSQFGSKKYSESVARSYKSYLNSYIVERSGCINSKGMVKLCELIINLKTFVSQDVSNDMEGNELKKERNVKSAAKVMIDYLNYILRQQS